MIDRRPDEAPVVGNGLVAATIGYPDVDVADGQSLRVTCTASGNPSPSIQWEKDGLQIGSTGRMRVDAGGTLRVVNFQEQDVGIYSCIASNSEGTDRQPIAVNRASKTCSCLEV